MITPVSEEAIMNEYDASCSNNTSMITPVSEEAILNEYDASCSNNTSMITPVYEDNQITNNAGSKFVNKKFLLKLEIYNRFLCILVFDIIFLFKFSYLKFYYFFNLLNEFICILTSALCII